ncbi:hypothetical protein [Paenibacillus validus]|uniref:hypothetical protein n=1 Tax=Paenibacillus validus TaxID=44253 RepID=UPI003D2CA21E
MGDRHAIRALDGESVAACATHGEEAKDAAAALASLRDISRYRQCGPAVRADRSRQ